MTGLPDEVLAWVLAGAAPGSEVREVTGLRQGGAPWLIRFTDEARNPVVVRTGKRTDRSGFATDIEALTWANRHRIAAPELVAFDLDEQVSAGAILMMMVALSGTSHHLGPLPPARLNGLGAALAEVHRAPVPQSPVLPLRTSPIAAVDFGALRRSAPVRPLLSEAERVIATVAAPDQPLVFVHGDFWHGNTVWDDDSLTGIVDWDCAGVGQPGVDLGSLRCDAALCGGPEGPVDVLAGYEARMGRPANDVAYWDVVAALATPPTIDWFTEAIRDQGHSELDQPTLLARRDAFLEAALAAFR